MLKTFVTCVCLQFAFAAVASADTEFFEAKIRPILVEHCYACHNSADTAEGDLAVDFRQGLIDGGSEGALIVPGDPAKSRLLAILKHEVEGLEMPEDSAKLDDAVIADFAKWIADGANDPRDEPPSVDELERATSWESKLERRKQWWSFQPIEKPEVPQASGNPIDSLVRAKLNDIGLSPSPPADPSTLIRRLYFQLIGLPPTPEQLIQWTTQYSIAKADRTNVTEELIDHLLASKQFGPRWARHWMDWIRYAESHGSEGDPEMKNAWMYRDYLIRALNADIPYDQLVREHLAGDMLVHPRINKELGLNESLLGTIQLRMVFHGFSPTDALDEKVRFVDDQVNAISKAFLGITVSCARCHDHKFDAISQSDYYAMFGMFAACRPGRAVADNPDQMYKNRDALAILKSVIKNAIATSWTDAMPTLGDRINKKIAGDVPDHSLLSMIQNWKEWPTESNLTTTAERAAVQSWHLADTDDFSNWITKGIKTKPTAAGQFAVALSGENALQGVYPAGVYSHLISTKHPLRITSPDVMLDGKYDYWVRACGGDDAATRYVTQDYPRTGTVFQASKLNNHWTWHRLKLDYWEGDSVHFELATGPDIPLQASDKMRSWFGATEVRVVEHDAPLPESNLNFVTAILQATDQPPKSIDQAANHVVRAIDDSIRAWRNGDCTDSQAELIDHAIRLGLLTNRIDSLPEVQPHIDRYRKLEAEIPIPTRVPGLDDVPSRTQPLYVRGNHKQPADLVPRRFLEAIDDDPYSVTESGRRQFADDILREDNPLARRVIVNRIWHHMFGKGIVATPDNFGKLGSLPTHPELLDWLAVRFVEDGWSLKKLIRLIATSATWQQSSKPSAQSLEMDPDNDYLSHANVRRLEAETIRDAMLLSSGTIDLSNQSAPVDAKSSLRSMFLRVHRNSLDPMLRAFDFPEPHSAVGRRDVTNVPAQSLLMMNSPQVSSFANSLANLIQLDESVDSDPGRISQLYLRTFSRFPTAQETESVLDHLESTRVMIANQQRELKDLKDQIHQRQERIIAIMEPKRAELADQDTPTSPSAIVQPIGQWEFDKDASDGIGSLRGTITSGAQIADGKLHVRDGGHVNTAPLARSLKAKTMEAWVQLDNLEQRGGGVMTVQSPDGGVFDSIVFAEKQERRWLAGSNGFARTEAFSGADEESDADKRLVHVAIAYHEDGTIVGYRDGKRYGRQYKSSGPVVFNAGQAIVSFGVRHLPNQGNRRLAGALERANLYDRALSDAEIMESFLHWSGRVSDQIVMDALSESERSELTQLNQQNASLNQQIESLGSIATDSAQDRAWRDLVRTMFMLKEFVYVR